MALSAELEGKTAEEVEAFYQQRITQQKQVYDQALEALGETGSPSPKPNQPAPRKPATMTEFMADPDGTTRKLINEEGVSRAEFQAASALVQESLIYTAKQRAQEELRAEIEKQGGVFDWARIAPALDEISKKCDGASLCQPSTWKTMYYYNLGTLQTTLTKEAVTKATMPAETVTPGGNVPDPKKPLSREEDLVAAGLGLTAETYQSGKAHMVENRFPLTMDNRNRR